MNKKCWMFGILLFISFIIITILVIFGYTSTFDDGIYNIVRSVSCSSLDSFFIIITNLGGHKFVIIATLFLIILFRNKYSILLGFLISNSAITNFIIKISIKRPRPDVLKLVHQGGYSFPSGHTMIAFALYGFLIYVVIKKVKNKILKYGLITIFGLIILLIGISRIYVGVHYASDVLGGAILSLLEVLFIIRYADKKILGE